MTVNKGKLISLGDWVNRRRVELEFDLRALSTLSDVHFSTINRIENGESDPTLETVIRLIDALKSTPADVIGQIKQKKPLALIKSEGQFLSKVDVLNFLKLLRTEPTVAATILAEALSVIDEKLEKESNLASRRKIPSNPFSIEEIFHFLLPEERLQLYPFEVTIKYPPLSNSQLPMDAYLQNAALVIQDLKAITQAPPIETPTLSGKKYDYHSEARIIEAIKTKFVNETQLVGKLKLSEILNLDKFFTQNGEFFLMACEVAKEEITTETSYLEKPGVNLIIISRWITSLNLPMIDWIERVRHS